MNTSYLYSVIFN